MSNELTKTYKKGSEKPCIVPKSDLNMATDTVPYCKEHYSDEPAEYEECIKPENFGVYCCYKEFGSTSLKERQECFAKLTPKDEK